MKAELISIGDELLVGQVVNTNATYLAKKLGEIGIEVFRVTTVGDKLSEIRLAFQRAWKEADIVIVTGGLGPTHDDISKEAVAKFFKKKLHLDKKTLKAVEDRFARFGYKKMPESNISQAMVPEGFEVLRNGAGTAPGLLYSEKGKTFVILPGVPREMKWIMEDSLLKKLKRSIPASQKQVIAHRTLMTYGIGESALAELVGDMKDILEEGATLAYLPNVPVVRMRITVIGKTERLVAAKVARIESRIRAKAEKYIFGVDDIPLEEIVGKLLLEKNVKLATAESCTGGLLSARLTDIPGISVVFLGGVVSYWDEVKRDMLGVPSETLHQFGAVSEETARAMAEGVRDRLGADVAVSITGIAGPSGGSDEKPVGTVWIGLAKEGSETSARLFHFVGDRELVRERSVYAALDMIRKSLV
jgi:nicotinamide-nucleotide amidase